MTQRPYRLLRRRDDGVAEVRPIELLFDLVYVFAIGQLSHRLLAHVDARGGAQTLILTLSVIYAWYMTAWGTNWLEPERLPVRLCLVGLMFASLLVSVSIGRAFGAWAWLFVTGYLLFQLVRSALLIVALHGKALGEHFVNDLVWELAAGALWVAGAFAGGDTRLVLWALAVAIALGGVGALHWLPGRGRRVDLGHTEIAGAHLIERFRLFFLIALGETVVTTGTAFTGKPLTVERIAALAIAFTGTVALWWVYFERVEGVGAEAAETSDDAGTVGWQGQWTLTLIVLALISIAVGDELAIAHPGDDVTFGFAILTFGGPAVFLLAQILFLHAWQGRALRSRSVGLVALGLLALATASLTLIVGIAASAAVLTAVAIADTVRADQPAANRSS